ncbi:MAG: gliding motility-associated C-terminal domain-containing protein, partial [Mameliella sp.]|nr:gliding motility-associated C-terminal domain-containing protein [Phaeodactylibacter sp.]
DLNISYNKFQGTLQSFSSLENLVFLKVNNNLIDSLNDEELQYFNDLSLFNCSNNNLTFDDVIGLSGVSTIYFPQKALELPDTISVFAGQDFNFSLGIDNEITNNSYDWFKNGSELFNTNENTITLNVVLEVDSGSYFVRVFNSEAPDLILESTTFFLKVIYTPITIDFDVQIESCPSALDGEISIFTEGGVPPYSYQWSTGHESTPVVSNLSSGDYFLTVTDSADSSLVFSFNLPPHNLPIANTIADTIACGSSITLTGNPSGDNVFGKWETASESIIENPFFYNTYVSNLDSGANVFTWAFSTDTCPRYTVDTVTVISARAPNVADDQVDIDEGSLIQLTPNENDWIQPELEWSIDFNNYSPGIYDLEFKDGVLDIFLKEERSGILVHSLNYEICYKECPDLCGEALITLRENFFNKSEIPNAFTPNGDGINDLFEIPELDGLHPLSSNIKLVVFNRWGDLVFSASPYSNNWDGTNIYSGKPLPEGTYYFKLWLNSTSSELMEGSVTILR